MSNVKKKIGDLTLREFIELKKRCYEFDECEGCPFEKTKCGITLFEYYPETLDQEIEVKDNE